MSYLLVLILLILFALICTPVEELHRDTSVLTLLTSTIVSNRVKKTFLLSNIIKSTIYVLNNNNVSINSKNIRNTTFSISDRYGFNSI